METSSIARGGGHCLDCGLNLVNQLAHIPDLANLYPTLN